MLLKHFFLKFLIAIYITVSISSVQAQIDPRNVLVRWQTSDEYDGKENLDLKLCIKNSSRSVLDLGRTDLWFTSMYPVVQREDKAYTITDNGGNLFRIRFKDELSLGPQDSIMITYASQFPIFNKSIVPNGFYFQNRANPSLFFPVKLEATPVLPSAADQNSFWRELYKKNVARQVSSQQKIILPSPASAKLKNGQLKFSGKVGYWLDKGFEDLEINMMEFASDFPNLSFVPVEVNPKLTIIKKDGYAREGYSLNIDKKGVHIEASSSAGAFYALQSLRSLLPAAAFNALELRFPFASIKDAPRFAYRGLMIDVARNFKSKSTIIKYLDMMSKYKLNTFHFHFSDDEGWRIEIPSLPELTQIGANRTPLYLENKGIQPIYGSGGFSTSSDFLSRADFVEILKYAKDHYITVVPEIETPGHGRAAIKAMEARYYNYLAKGDTIEANKYLLHDNADTSVYTSAQYWHDNVMNPALPSVYVFLATVIEEFKAMYLDAGLELKKISLGGDEVPRGVWEGSPKIRQLMDSLGMISVNEVWPYYVQQINKICIEKGVTQAGWEEIGMVNKGDGMVVNENLSSLNMELDVWNNLIGGGNEDLAYRLANAGYKTVFISASNNYFDMAWNANFTEPGLNWATYADLYQSYLFMPKNFFTNIHLMSKGIVFEEGHFKDKIRLNENARDNLIGIKGGLWAETVQNERRLDYMIFPRLFSLAERAWAPRKGYEKDNVFDQKAFNKDYSELINTIGNKELPKIASEIKFRLPAVGVLEKNGKLYANTEYPGFTIYYTEDGSKPTKNSPVYNNGVKIKKGHSYSFATISDDGRRSTVSLIQL